ncbi:DUF4344 domain-containing metallopeptidase [Gloeothece verrucosa]|uniref:Metallopeptidase n=1 Tax=Gloeothece verrucosa (strain PCC 7822) TaxID=497965 RepID=E0U9M6_GLOV7|nr:DUF4344 domain-containing metallopeptidase [Gloeothece verrucosa]ADN13827.1 hypothetical protein Cyan7822_1841 [Gloeothece verrucosa PCC 7822]
MFKPNLKKFSLSLIASSLTVMSGLIFDGLVSHALAQTSTGQKQSKPVQSMGNKQLKSRVGKFVLVYQPSRIREHQALQEFLQKVGLFEALISVFNNSGLVMRYDVPVVFADCGVVNAFYSPENKSITMCHELIFQMAKDFIRVKKVSTEEALTDALFASVFVFFHELGHALIDILPLPTVGNEEDAVDQFSAILLLDTEKPDVVIKTVYNAALWFGNSPQAPAWDEHAPSDVRYYNLICLMYGKDSNQYGVFAKELQGRATKCGNEYKKVSQSWEQLLLPHFADNNNSRGGNSSSEPPRNPPSRGARPGQIW